MKPSFTLAAAAFAFACSGAVMAGPGEDLAKAQKCDKCHTAKTTKKGPAWSEVATKYAGKADSPAKLFTYLKTGGKMADGDEHKKVEAADADIKALVEVVLKSK